MDVDARPELSNANRVTVATPGLRRRAKSSLRLKYEAETHVIERKLGDLETIRERLGLTQRKMAQLLLVDPSAWTRWTKGDDEAPPHIYRMLQWYLALEEKYPALDVNFWLNTVAQIPEKSGIHAQQSRVLQAELHAARDRLDSLEEHFEQKERALRLWFGVVLFATAVSGVAIGFVLSR